MNIVSMAAQYLTPMIIDRLASSLGITSPLAQKAIAAILPTILAGIVGRSAKPEGLGALTKALGQQDPGFLDKLGSVIGGAGQADVARAGSDLLGSILGGSGLGAMTGAVSKFAGIGDAPTKGLIGMLAPVALGALAKEQKAANLDAGGLAKMLMGQKDNIAAAMPPGFSDLLKGSGLLDGISVPAAPAAARPAAPAPAAHHAPPPAPAKSGGGILPWIIALALAALAGWWFLGQKPSVASLPTPPNITVGGQNIASEIHRSVDGLRSTLAGIKDEASAKAALPRLQDMSGQLEKLGGLRNQLPAAEKSSLASYIASLLPIIRPWIDNALKGSGVEAVARPVLNQIFTRLEAMTRT